MAFDKQQPVTRNPSVGDMEITLFRTTDQSHPDYHPQGVARFRIMVKDQLGAPMNHLNGNLIPHLEPPHTAANLIAFLDWLWAKAVAEVEP
jgi:hypothetical protein